MSFGGGRSLAEPAFPDDDGLVDPALADILGDAVELLARLGTARVFVPVVAILNDDPQVAAVEGDKNSEMAAVLMTGADGRTALLTFSSVATMTAWNPQARPVSVLGRDAARAAIADQAAAMLFDLGSPHFQVVETEDLHHLAAEDVLVRTAVGTAWVGAGEESGKESLSSPSDSPDRG